MAIFLPKPICKEMSQFLVAHSPDAVSVGLLVGAFFRIVVLYAFEQICPTVTNWNGAEHHFVIFTLVSASITFVHCLLPPYILGLACLPLHTGENAPPRRFCFFPLTQLMHILHTAHISFTPCSALSHCHSSHRIQPLGHR